jgi:hypothetical protein
VCVYLVEKSVMLQFHVKVRTLSIEWEKHIGPRVVQAAEDT